MSEIVVEAGDDSEPVSLRKGAEEAKTAHISLKDLKDQVRS